MDPISIAIVITVLSVGTVLVYLFKSDFDGRHKRTKCLQEPSNSGNSKRTSNVGNNKNSCKQQTAPKPHLVEASKQVRSSSSEPAATKQQTNGHKLATNNANINVTKGSNLNHNNNINNSNNNNNVKANTTTKRPTLHLADPAFNHETPGVEPSIDELDLSASLDRTNNGANNNNKYAVIPNRKPNSPQADRKLANNASKKRSINQQSNSGDSSVSYSSEQLFGMIAASNLSKEEVEMAVETLLNKIESGASDWKKPKSDPMQRLKNQLRDSESALTIEIQNHEQTRARIVELKAQVQNEKSSGNLIKDELVKLRKEFGILSLTLERTRCDLSKQQILNKQLNDDSSKAIGNLEQDNAQLKAVLANSTLKETDFKNLRQELDDKLSQLQRYELTNHNMSERIQELEAKLRGAELQIEQFRSSKQHDDYEACAKISELEADRMGLEKALKDHVARFKEVSETNNLLEKSNKELQTINAKQEEMLKRLRDERHLNEASMKRTLCEMEQELKELQTKLSANSASHDERFRKEMSQVEKELSNADQREQKLSSELRQLRDGLSKLFPEIAKANSAEKNRSDDWVHQYLAAIRQLAKTVEELREPNNNNSGLESPSKKSVDKSTLTFHTASSRVGSPTSNGRSSRGSHYSHDGEKKLMETKLLELNEYIEELKANIQKLNDERKDLSNESTYKQEIKELKLQKSKLEAQIKFGLDSLKMEQGRIRRLEEELSKYSTKEQSQQVVQ